MSTAAKQSQNVVTREEWLKARKEFLVKEKEFTHQREALSAERRKLPMVRVEKDYVFEGPNGGQHARGAFRGQAPADCLPLHVRPGLGARVQELLVAGGQRCGIGRTPGGAGHFVRDDIARSDCEDRRIQEAHGLGFPVGVFERERLQL